MHPFDDNISEETERSSTPKLVKDILDIDQLLKSLDKIPLTTEEEKEEWRRKEKERARIKSWKIRLKESGVPESFFRACVMGKIERKKLLSECRNKKNGCLWLVSEEKGKTFSACALLATEIWKGRGGFYIRSNELEREMSKFQPNPAVIRKAESAPLLILDDFEGVRMSSSSSSNFIAFLKKRNDYCFLTIIVFRKWSDFSIRIAKACD